MLETLLPASVTGPILWSAMWLVICGCLFGFLQHLTPLDPHQRQLRADSRVDIIYWLGAPVIYGSVGGGLTIAGFLLIFNGDIDAAVAWSKTGSAYIGALPFWAQVLGVLIVSDISMYATHRLFHTSALWRFHAIHHSPTSLDWLHAVRFHPVNMIFHGLIANSITMWIGFPPLAIAALGPFNVLYSAMVHANLNWTFGPLRHVFTSPVFHRWHHTAADEGGSKNFAATFSFIDHIFGTFYMPKDKKPMVTGLTEADMPTSLVGQLVYPFAPPQKPNPAQNA